MPRWRNLTERQLAPAPFRGGLLSDIPEQHPIKVWVCLEGPDMTYYGDAELHGVYSSKESAEKKAQQVAAETGHGYGSEWDPISVFEVEVEQ